MALMHTPAPVVGSRAPDFRLKGIDSKIYSFKDIAGKSGTLVMFICNHCPYVQLIEAELMNIARSYGARGISFLAISSNDPVQYPQDGPEEMRKHAVEMGYPFPYLFDATQEVARAFDAACTPDFFVYDTSGRLY